MLIILDPIDICLSIDMCWADAPCMSGSGRVPAMEAARGCLCLLFLRCSREERGPGTGPECVSMEGAWVMTELDWAEGSACWPAMLQLRPLIPQWDGGWCWEWGCAWG